MYLIAAVICSAAFFVHEFFPNETLEHEALRLEYNSLKKVRTKEFNKLKKASAHLPEYKSYTVAKKNATITFNKLRDQKIKDSFLGFTNFNQFLGEFGWALGLSLYSLFMLIVANFRSKQSKGEYILHGTLLSIGLFYIYYTIQPFKDFNKITYIAFAFITSVTIVFAVRFIIMDRKRYIQSLLSNIRTLVSFVLNNTKEDKEEEKWNVLEKVANDE